MEKRQFSPTILHLEMTGLFSVLKMTNASPSFSPNIVLAWARFSVSEEERKKRASREKAIEQ